ncbi:hypothetical protein [Methylobacterium sp. WSM2598]|uniref:hypothetical protein n=1 Tax=Methylobacterium sp. WSM2598 TaxID=398261 RepID=UPI0003A51A38|nr:hypothetical protein [Methylobacterium sp. WSM2598]
MQRDRVLCDGGGLDIAVLGMAEADAAGNVNVSRFGPKLAGAGGFINISQNARKVVFAGTITVGGLGVRIESGQLRIVQEGRARKFHEHVEQITFSGRVAADKTVLYITERCVFRLRQDGLELIEVAPGVDVEREILAHMNFRPMIKGARTMDPRIFAAQAMGLRERMRDLNLADRLADDPDRNVLFLNFEGLHVRRIEDVAMIQEAVAARCRQVGRRMAVVVNYDAFQLDREVADAYAEMVRALEQTYSTRVSRSTTSAFMRVKLGHVLTRTMRPHIFESRAEAQAFRDSVREP